MEKNEPKGICYEHNDVISNLCLVEGVFKCSHCTRLGPVMLNSEVDEFVRALCLKEGIPQKWKRQDYPGYYRQKMQRGR